MYQLTDTTNICRLTDGASIPADPANGDYAHYLQWCEAGNAPLPADPPPVETIIAAVTAAVQQRLDDFARTHNYDGILSACTYATSTVPKFAAEGQYAVEARDQTWATCYQIMGEVMQGLRPMPSLDQVMGELPDLEWPA